MVGECLDERLGMSAGGARGAAGGGGLGGDIGVAALPDLLRLGVREDAQVVGVLLVPAERLLLAVDPNVEVVLLAWADLGGGEDALHALLHVAEDVAVVVESPAQIAGKIREHLGDP